VNLVVATKTNVLTIPTTAVFLKDGASFVLVKNGKTTESRAVTIGLVGSTTDEVVSGLQEGEQVVTLGQ
jgi:membrane fusion protein (multidrug efflux system)